MRSIFVSASLSLVILPAFCVLRAATLTPELALKVRHISEITFSPDGAHLACTVSEPPKGDERITHIWLLDTHTHEFRQFTSSAKSEHAPRWSPDSRTLAFLSNRQERSQVYTIRIDGGEARAVTSGKTAITAFRWSSDGGRIAFLATEPKSVEDERREKEKDDGQVADDERDLPRLWTVDADGAHTAQINRGPWKIEEFEWLDSGRILTVASDRPRVEQWTQALYAVSLADGQFSRFGNPVQPFGSLTISPDAKAIAYTGTRDAGPAPHDLYLSPSTAFKPSDATAGIDRPVVGLQWQSNGVAVVAVIDGFRRRLYRVESPGPATPIDLPASFEDYGVAADGTVAWAAVSFNQLPELWIKHASGAATQVSHLQQGWDDVKLADAELFHYKSFDGRDMEAALMQPAGIQTGVQTGAKLPLILYVHGGPSGAFGAAYNTWVQLLAAHGYAVVMPNPRGSSGYGEDFLKANRADWGGADFKDTMAAVDAVLARGNTDPGRLGIGGWSYGGYMAEWAITQTNRFHAAVSGAGMFDLAAEFGTEDDPAYDEWYSTTPWENPDRFYKSSPATYIKNAKTPTLILQGADDAIDPVGQSTALFRALKRYNVETELVIYPREPHGPREELHGVDILKRMLSWFDRHLSSSPSTSPQSKP